MDARPEKEEIDLYNRLNVPRDASTEDIRKAYRKLSRTYHPDKHTDPEQKEVATNNFTRIHEAYEILVDVYKRKIYDEFGMEGVKAAANAIEGMEITKYTYEEFRSKYQQSGGPSHAGMEGAARQGGDPYFTVSNAVQVKVDGTGLPELLYDLTALDSHHLVDMEYFVTPFMITRTSLATSATAFITQKNTIVTQLNLVADVGDGVKTAGNSQIAVTARRQFSSRMFGETSVAFSPSKALALNGKIFRKVSERAYLQLESSYYPVNNKMQMSLMHMRQLTDRIIGRMTWSTGISNGVACAFSRSPNSKADQAFEHDDQDIESMSTWKFFKTFLFWLYDSASWKVSAEVGHDIGLRAVIKRAIGKYSGDGSEGGAYVKLGSFIGVQGGALEFGGGRKFIHSNSEWAMKISVGYKGVVLFIDINRGGHALTIPIQFSREPDASLALLLTASVASLVAVIQTFIVRPLKKASRAVALEEERKRRQSTLEQYRKEAKDAIELMRATVQKCIDRENAVQGGGLIILRAIYGSPRCIRKAKLEERSHYEYDELDAEMTEVTMAVQYLVEDSKIQLYGSSKASLVGFWDPTLLGDEKVLRIWYRFQGSLHETTITDFEPLELPLRDHIV